MAGIDKRRYSDRRPYFIRAVHKQRKKVRMVAVAYQGGKRARCGYDRCIEAFEFHRTDPTKKDFGVSSKDYTRSWNWAQEE